MPTHTLTLLLDSVGRPRAVSIPAFELRVVKGPDKGKKAESNGRDSLVIGSSPSADLPLTDPTVSALHCRIGTSEQGFRVLDLGAKNGVWLDGRRVRDAELHPKDELEVGRSRLKFVAVADSTERALHPNASFGRLHGSGWRMRQLFDQLAKAAQSEATVLLEGETGTGKEIAAEAIVEHGPRAAQPLVVVDCASLSPSLAEAELFGHEAGSFTGAHTARAGAFERAHRGTLFLDSVGELAPDLQPRLLGVLERRSVTRIGGAKPVPIDVRVIAATQRSLEREVNEGRFRSDLFYRLAALHLRLPALREHAEDIPTLVAQFLSELPKRRALRPDVLERLYQREYAGNVRELRNLVERAAAGLDELEDGPGWVPPVELAEPFRLQKERLLARFEHAYLVKLLEACGGNVSEAARRAGLNRVHLHELLKRHQVRER